jgi:hypothetical protein
VRKAHVEHCLTRSAKTSRGTACVELKCEKCNFLWVMTLA